MSKTSHRTRIQLERLTGIHERRVVGPGEDSFTLAAGAARDCLSHSQHRASDLQMLINTSITRSKGQFSQSFEPPLSLEEQRIRKGDRVMLLALASGIEIGIAIFTVDSMVDRYGNSH